METIHFSFHIDGHCDTYYKVTHPKKLRYLTSQLEQRITTRGVDWWRKLNDKTRSDITQCIDKEKSYKVFRSSFCIIKPRINDTPIRRDRIRMDDIDNYVPDYIDEGMYLVFRNRCDDSYVEYNIESEDCFENKKLKMKYCEGGKKVRAYGRMDVLASEIEYDGKTILPSLIQTNEPSTPFSAPYAEVFIIEK